jgi:hypothetical protein
MTTGRINQVTTVETPAHPKAHGPDPPDRRHPEEARRRGTEVAIILEGTGNRPKTVQPARPGTFIDPREEVTVPRPSNCPH